MIEIEISAREIIILSTVMYVWDEGEIFEEMSEESYANLYSFMEIVRDLAVNIDGSKVNYVWAFGISYPRLEDLIAIIRYAYVVYEEENYRRLADNFQLRLNAAVRNN